MNGKKKFGPLRLWVPASALFLSALLVWFAVGQYRKAFPVAAENLRGLALSLSAAVEAIAAKDPSLSALKGFRADDMAYFAVIDQGGAILYHSNELLIGKRIGDDRYGQVFSSGETGVARTALGTGEEIYESNSPIHYAGRVAALRMALHTFRADAVIRGARTNMLILFGLLALAWIMGYLLYRMYLRAEAFRDVMARRERLARLGEMGAVLAHEIRNPLAGIKGYAQLLQENPGYGDRDRPAALIVEESLRLERLVNDLLVLVRPSEPRKTPVPIAEALRRSLEVIGREASAQGVVIEAEMGEDPLTCCDGDGMEQVLLNIMRNSLQAMPDGGRLGISLEKCKDTARIVIRDTGHGIPLSDLERVFDPFHTTRARGTGLGLAICARIVEDCGGRIAIAETSEKGTTVAVTLPLSSGAGAAGHYQT